MAPCAMRKLLGSLSHPINVKKHCSAQSAPNSVRFGGKFELLSLREERNKVLKIGCRTGIPAIRRACNWFQACSVTRSFTLSQHLYDTCSSLSQLLTSTRPRLIPTRQERIQCGKHELNGPVCGPRPGLIADPDAVINGRIGYAGENEAINGRGCGH